MMKTIRYIMLALLSGFAIYSCSTTKAVPEGSYRLARNKITVTDKSQINTGDLEQYIKQSPNSYIVFGWNPFLNIYNWTNGKGKGWDKFVTKIGVAPVVFDPDLVESSKTNMINHLRYLGYYGTTIKDTITYKKRKAYVEYRVTPGKRFPIKYVNYIIADSTLYAITMADTAASPIKAGTVLSEESLDKESQRLTSVYKNNGYYRFSKNHLFFEADTTAVKDSAILDIRIENYTRNENPDKAVPHRQFYFDKVTIRHPQQMKIRQKALLRFNKIKPGDMYAENLVNNTYSRFSAIKLFSSVNISLTETGEDRIDCDISLSQSKIQGMKINMEASTNSSGLFGISPSISYFNKNIFRGGEQFTLSFMGNFQFKFNDPIRSNELGVSAGLSFPKFVFLPDKLFKGAVPRTDLNMSYNFQSRPEYTRNIISTSLGYSWNNNNNFYYSVNPIQLNIIRLFDLDPDFYEDLSNNPYMQSAYQNHFDLGLGTTIYYTTDNSVNPKGSYFYSRLQFDLAGNVLSLFNPLMPVDANGSRMIWNTPYSQYVRTELTFVKTWVFGMKDNHSIAVRGLGGIGYSYGNSTALPFEKQFYSGGANSMRGWQSRALGPGMSPMNSNFVIPNQSGDFKLEANLEYRVKIAWKFAGAIFVDAGNIWNLRPTGSDDLSAINKDTFFRSIALDWGVGLRLDLDFVLLRIDLGLKTYDPSYVTLVPGTEETPAVMAQKGWVRPGDWFRNDNFSIHFGVGYPF